MDIFKVFLDICGVRHLIMKINFAKNHLTLQSNIISNLDNEI